MESDLFVGCSSLHLLMLVDGFSGTGPLQDCNTNTGRGRGRTGPTVLCMLYYSPFSTSAQRAGRTAVWMHNEVNGKDLWQDSISARDEKSAFL